MAYILLQLGFLFIPSFFSALSIHTIDLYLNTLKFLFTLNGQTLCVCIRVMCIDFPFFFHRHLEICIEFMLQLHFWTHATNIEPKFMTTISYICTTNLLPSFFHLEINTLINDQFSRVNDWNEAFLAQANDKIKHFCIVGRAKEYFRIEKVSKILFFNRRKSSQNKGSHQIEAFNVLCG